jgi:para-aminobenzoate synthetase
MRTLLVDNYDSYTYNVFHLLAGVSGEEPIVVENDAISWRALSRWDFDAIVLSPGPGHPKRWHDFGVCQDILRYSEVPVLGICLGHQGLGRALDGIVGSAPVAMHGRLSQIRHAGDGLFEDIPQDFSVVRYHSLTITGSLGPEGRVTAWTDDGVVMGIEHLRRPLWGVQFHPESISTEHGQTLVRNFYSLAESRRAPRTAGIRKTSPAKPVGARPAAAPADSPETGVEVRMRTIAGEPSTEAVFEGLFGAEEHAFWLDSADAPTWLGQSSYMGTGVGPERRVLSYDVDAGEVRMTSASGEEVERRSIFSVLNREVSRLAVGPPEGMPRGLIGGFVGYLGYECKADCGSTNAHSSDIPDALFMLADRVVAVDHTSATTHLLAVCHGDEEECERWLDEAEALVCEELANPSDRTLEPAEAAADHVCFRSGRGRDQYLADIEHSLEEILAGETYEVCLTDQISTDASPDPFHLYKVLRRRNPAPFASYLRFGEVAVVSSSPERFLSVDRDRFVQARPIKGTISRSDDPAEDAARKAELEGDEKTSAEHLMIVDLLRNDLGRVCEVDSVSVPDLMVVEPYATVHQVVSTVTGVLDPRRSGVECVRACFPGGSMTGAPKLRTMEIIDELEDEARGVYSGGLGYFGLDGVVDLSIVIRTIVIRPGRTTIGAGGAIVMQSDPEDEFDEILLKARAPMAAIAEATTGRDSTDAWSIELEPARAAAR